MKTSWSDDVSVGSKENGGLSNLVALFIMLDVVAYVGTSGDTKVTLNKLDSCDRDGEISEEGLENKFKNMYAKWELVVKSNANLKGAILELRNENMKYKERCSK